MEVNGRDVRFCRTVAANCRIADLCKDGDISNIGTLLSGKYQDSQKIAAKFIAIMSDGYEQKMKFADPGHEPDPISEEEAMTLEERQFSQLFDEAFKAWMGEKPTIETQPVKKTKKTKAEQST